MEWRGLFSVTSRVGKPVVIDEWSFPRAVTANLEGEGNAPDFTATFELRDGRPECTEIRAFAKSGGHPVTNADLRLFDLESLAVRAFRDAAGRPLWNGGHAVSRRQPEHAEEVAEVIREAQDTDAQLVRVARAYLEDVHGAPLAAVQRYLGGSRRTAARWVARARKQDPPLIPPQGAPAEEYAVAREALRQEPSSQAYTIEEMNAFLGWDKEGDGDSGEHPEA